MCVCLTHKGARRVQFCGLTWVLVDVLRRRNRPSYPEDLDVLRSRGEDALGPLGLGRALSAVGAVPAMRIEEQQVQRSALGPFAVG